MEKEENYTILLSTEFYILLDLKSIVVRLSLSIHISGT